MLTFNFWVGDASSGAALGNVSIGAVGFIPSTSWDWGYGYYTVWLSTGLETSDFQVSHPNYNTAYVWSQNGSTTRVSLTATAPGWS